MRLRPYQEEAVDSIFDYFRSGNDGNPIVVLPTGSGKSLVQASFIRTVIGRWPAQRFLCLTHVKELVEQNGAELIRLWPEAEFRVGYYNAAMGRKDIGRQITFASVQSVYKHALKLGHIDLVIIDECHLCPPKGSGMYRTFLGDLRKVCPGVKVIGLTATPFRLGSGMLHQGDGALFSDICYNADIKGLIRDGYLSPLTTALSRDRADLSSVKTRGGEYVAGELERAMDQDELVHKACREIVRLGADRKKWLVFCAGVSHAEHVRDALRELGESAETITGTTGVNERDRLVADFRAGKFRALTNMNVLTTGFNVPDVDLLAILRPTKSTSLHIQMLGRGMRIAPGKADCLVLDFCGNILEHGPIDQIEVKAKGASDEPGKAPQKQCPECGEVVALAAAECRCGHEFETVRELKHSARPVQGGHVLTPDEPEWTDVTDVKYAIHRKEGRPPSLRVDYYHGLRRVVSEWVCIEHDGYAAAKARSWWRDRASSEPPESAAEALQRAGEVRRPSKVLLVVSGKYPEILRIVD